MAKRKTKLLDLSLNSAPLCAGVRNEYGEFIALLNNAIRIVNTSYMEEKRIKDLLINNNYVGYDDLLKVWTMAQGTGDKNPDNLPRQAIFTYPSKNTSLTRRLSYEPERGGAYLIQGLPSNITWAEIIRSHTDLMYECDIAIYQNLRATKTPYWVAVQDDNSRLSVQHAIQQQQQGLPVIIADPALLDNMKGQAIATPITFDKVYEFRQKIRNSLLNKLSTLTANRDKLERVQSAEVNAGVGECEDYIYSMIDNFNRQTKQYGLAARMELNSSLEELYTGASATSNITEEII